METQEWAQGKENGRHQTDRNGGGDESRTPGRTGKITTPQKQQGTEVNRGRYSEGPGIRDERHTKEEGYEENTWMKGAKHDDTEEKKGGKTRDERAQGIEGQGVIPEWELYETKKPGIDTQTKGAPVRASFGGRNRLPAPPAGGDGITSTLKGRDHCQKKVAHRLEGRLRWPSSTEESAS